MASNGYEDLEVYQRAFALLKPVHLAVLKFPDYEKFDLANQMRRASKSVAANIVEGYALRRSPKEFCSYLARAVGSANEMEGHIKVARELDYLKAEECDRLLAAYQVVGKQLTKLIQFWRTRKDLNGPE